jgi:Uma2 family endonuclease
MVIAAASQPLPGRHRQIDVPTGPTVEVWRTMAPIERERFLVRVNEALTELDFMSEGRPHMKAKNEAADTLRMHYRAVGRVMYVAEDMSVVYPGQPSFSPDVLAVVGVPQPEDDERLSWVVADEGRGPDLALEVLHRGDRGKDLVTNVERYASLGISEYFVYDRARQQIRGYRLPAPGATRYQPILPQAGQYSSTVLGLDLVVLADRLRFLYGSAELQGSPDLIGRLQGMVESLTTKADQAQAQADQAQAQAEQALAGLQGAIFATLEARGIACPDEDRARVGSCADPAALQQWLLRAVTAGSAGEVFQG